MPDVTGTAHDIKTIFTDALDLASDRERAAYLDRACEGSPDVRARVEALLAALGQAGTFLEVSPLAREGNVLGDIAQSVVAEPASSLAISCTSQRLRDPDATSDHRGPDSLTERPPDLMPLSTPARLGDFELVRRLGEGAMGVVFEARQVSLNRSVALKMIRAGLFADPADLRRFRLEAEAVAHLDHPRIVPIYGVWQHRDCHYFSMKLLRGGSLARRLADYAADTRGSARLVAEVARAIQHAHDRGIFHRDLKPSNILLDEEARPLVTDFGLAKRSGEDSSLTQSGAIVGTPSYMAPEQAAGGKAAVTGLTDVYGLGAVLYALLTGRAPFVATRSSRRSSRCAPARRCRRRGSISTSHAGWRRSACAVWRRTPGGATRRPRHWRMIWSAGSTAGRSRRGRSAPQRGPGCGCAAT
jgi:serine/threonine protein kinase